MAVMNEPAKGTRIKAKTYEPGEARQKRKCMF
jgi:hypothetical protein